MKETGAGEPDKARLRERASELCELAKLARVMTGTMAERDLERGRAELDEAIQSIERADSPGWAVADRLRSIAIILESALYMGGVNSSGGPSVLQLQARLAAWFERC